MLLRKHYMRINIEKNAFNIPINGTLYSSGKKCKRLSLERKFVAHSLICGRKCAAIRGNVYI